MSAVSWILMSVGALLVLGGLAVLRYRVPLAHWQQAMNERNAPFKSGPLGPGRTTPTMMAVIAVVFIAVGLGWIAGALATALS